MRLEMAGGSQAGAAGSGEAEARFLRTRTVREALHGAWPGDVGPDLEEAALEEFFTLWDWLRGVWERLWTAWGHVEWVPNADATLREWWCSLPFPRRARTDFRTGIILVLWTIWNHRNDVVFNGASPSLQLVVLRLQEEFGRWAHALFRGRVSIPASMVG
ncbi:hypothetical protein BRADI_5g03062v3 [Brachypodium distachyon]|uniref:Uncharacterized protein n=1 Tax=Brachypodium distachyon TaxID=15368 RepID=A0A2K2CF56_BRADI|nr:hypothetical protein BRADI_5g03062v3 [Brachypodium distachyon]